MNQRIIKIKFRLPRKTKKKLKKDLFSYPKSEKVGALPLIYVFNILSMKKELDI